VTTGDTPARPAEQPAALTRRDAWTAALLAALVAAAKIPTLGVPYLWDESIWSRGAYWLAEGSPLRAIPGLHPPATFAGHPAGLSVVAWPFLRIFGPSAEVAHAVAVAFACLGVAVTYLLGARLFGRATGALAALFLLASPVYFAQAGMFLGDLPVAALGVTSAWLATERRWLPCAVASVLLVWVKETGIAVVAAVTFYLLVAHGATGRTAVRGSTAHRAVAWPRSLGWRSAISYVMPPFVAAVAFFVWQKVQTGSFCCIYGTVSFDLFESSRRFYLTQLGRVLSWILLEQGRWVLLALAAAHLLLRPAARRRPEWVLFLLAPLFFALSFAGIYYLRRYTLPALPFLCLAGAWSLTALLRQPRARAAAGALVIGLFLAGWRSTEPIGTYEWNLRYLDVVRSHQEIYAALLERRPPARVVSHWPHTAQLLQPQLEYVTTPMAVVSPDSPAGEGCERVILTQPPALDEQVRRHLAAGTFQSVHRIEGPGWISAELFESRSCTAPGAGARRRAASGGS
jgi:hypothetical protein